MIKDVVFEKLVTHMDERGYLTEILRATDPHFTKFGQVYIVGNMTRGTIRAWHKHRVLWDWFFVSHGSAKFALNDDRPESPTYQEINTFVMGEKNPHILAVPPGIYHGWMSLEDDTQMISTASEVYNREAPDEERLPYYAFGFDWSIQFK